MSHTSCMTENHLTPEETVCVLDRLIELAETRAADWKFSSDIIATATLTNPDVEIYLHDRRSILGTCISVQKPAVLGIMYSKHECPSKLVGRRIEQLFETLHRARHAHHNAQIVDQFRTKLGVDFSGAEQHADEARTEREVSKLRALVADAMRTPVRSGAAIVGGVLVLCSILDVIVKAAFAG